MGIDGIILHSNYDVLIEYNSIHSHNDKYGSDPYGTCGDPCNGRGENGIDIKHDSHNIIIRYNKIYDHEYESEIILNGRPTQSADQVYIYGNNFFGGKTPGVHSQSNQGESYDDIYIFSNLFHNMGKRAISIAQSGSYYIFNNIVAENYFVLGGGSMDAGIYMGGAGSVLKNNIYYKNRPLDTSRRQLSVSAGSDENTISDHNIYYWPGQNSLFRWGDASDVSLVQIQNGNNHGLPQEQYSFEVDPGLTDLENSDYRVASSGSAVVDSGEAMGTGNIAVLNIQGTDYPVRWDTALHPSTDWSVFPSPNSIITANQNNYGSGWERGAYVYTGTSTPICSEGQITSACLCRGTEYSTGYCCSSSWQSRSCSLQATDYAILKTQYPITLDGNLNEFTNANEIVLTNSRGTQGTYKFLWDSNALYVAAEVSDSNLNSQQTIDESDLWNDDSLEMVFDTANNGGASMDYSDDYKFFINSLSAKTDTKRYDKSFDSGFTEVTLATGTNNVNTGYVIEAIIPWTNWAIPVENDIWRMNVVLNDDYGTGDENTLWSGSAINVPDDAGEIIFSSEYVASASSCTSGADSSGNNNVEIGELINFISEWKAGSFLIGELLNGIDEWKNGC